MDPTDVCRRGIISTGDPQFCIETWNYFHRGPTVLYREEGGFSSGAPHSQINVEEGDTFHKGVQNGDLFRRGPSVLYIEEKSFPQGTLSFVQRRGIISTGDPQL
jgi:hypothetical protein